MSYTKRKLEQPSADRAKQRAAKKTARFQSRLVLSDEKVRWRHRGYKENSQYAYTKEDKLLHVRQAARLITHHQTNKLPELEFFCSSCRAPVFLWDLPGAIAGMKAIVAEETGRHYRAKPGFRHYKKGAKDGCKNYTPNHPWFIGRGASGPPTDESKVVEAIHKFLKEPTQKDFNRKVLDALIRNLRGKNYPLTPVDQRRMGEKAEELGIFKMQIFLQQPWLLPFVLVILDDYQNRTNKEGFEYAVAYEGVDNQQVEFRDLDGAAKIWVGPQKIVKSFVNVNEAGEVWLSPMKLGSNRSIVVSHESAVRLAKSVEVKPPNREKRRYYTNRFQQEMTL